MVEQNRNIKETAEKLEAAESVEEIAEILRAGGCDISAEELEASLTGSVEGELSEEELENAAGGNLISWLAQIFYRIKTGKKHKCTYTPIDGLNCEVK